MYICYITIHCLINILKVTHLHARHNKGLRRRRTFIMILSNCKLWYVHYTTEDSGADEHLF